MRWDTLDPRPRGVSTDPQRLDVAYAHARSARPRREPRIRRNRKLSVRLRLGERSSEYRPALSIAAGLERGRRIGQRMFAQARGFKPEQAAGRVS